MPTPCPATTLPPGRWVLIVFLMIASAAHPPQSQTQDLTSEETPNSQGDSLALRLIEIDIEEARREAEATGLWHRLIPSVHLSASVGVSEIYFQDDPAAVILPRDAYRITFSLSLEKIFDTAEHEKAIYRIQRLETQHQLLRRRLAEEAQARRFHLEELRRSLQTTRAELGLQRRIARFYRMRFDQGEVDYPTRARAELAVIALGLRLRSLQARISEASSEPRPGRRHEEPP